MKPATLRRTGCSRKEDRSSRRSGERRRSCRRRCIARSRRPGMAAGAATLPCRRPTDGSGSWRGSPLVERLVEDRADQPVGVAVGLKIDRDAAADVTARRDGPLVVVAVDSTRSPSATSADSTILFDDEVPFRDEVGLLGAEDRRRSCCAAARTLMDQKIASSSTELVEIVADTASPRCSTRTADRALL